MAEIDYQLALLLQHKFEQETKKPKEYKNDGEIAKVLQEQFERENEIETPKNGLVYNTTKNNLDSSKCLIDPSWEIIDPTPDIHVLFTSFNDRFFWGTLVSVCVSWSKKMTQCAGVCAYQKEGHYCSISLSEPLLKLRPRKDLVETLLHEMIHAYLFLMNKDQDRDGHGVEFHKHMYRINKDAGTNITVYHDFHDEVRLYKQHWWQCDGPCRKISPFFGMVRRAINRAPGPNDKWWAEHARTCGGNYIKVKEPEKAVKKVPAKENNPREDIRKYISSTKEQMGPWEVTTSNAKPSTSSIKEKPKNNIHTITNTGDNNKKIGTVIPKANNIFGFNNLNGNSNSTKGKGIGKAVKNKTSTVVINKPPTAASKSNAVASSPSEALQRQLANVLSANNINFDYTVVRNHWLKKFSNETVNSQKRIAPPDSRPLLDKIPRLEGRDSVSKYKSTASTADCPVCLEPVDLSQFNDHLDQCLKKPKKKECIICQRSVVVAEYEMHVMKCSEEIFDTAKHIKEEVEEQERCLACQEMVPAVEFNAHVEQCLLKLYDDMEECSRNDELVDCLTCGENIRRSMLNAHLDDCVGLSKVFEYEYLPVKKEEEDFCEGDVEYKSICPLCMAVLPDEEMNNHIDSCLKTTSSSSQSEFNKNMLVKSLTDDEF